MPEDVINNNVNPLGSGYAHAGEMASPELLAKYEAEKLLPRFVTDNTVAWGIDISYYNGDAKKLIADAVSAGASFVIAKASDGTQLVAGSTSAEKNYVDPQFYNTVQYCQDNHIPVLGYHFFRYDNAYFPSFDINSPSADPQWRTTRLWMGLPLNQTKAPRAIYSGVTDLEAFKTPDNVWSYQEDGPVVIAERIQAFQQWMKANVNLTVDPYLTHWLLYTSPSFVKSYCPNVQTQIDGGSVTAGYLLWLATWLFVKKAITSFSQVSSLIPLTSWPMLGNWAEKIKFWQFGTVAINGSEVDLNIYKGTKAELYDWLGFKDITPPIVTTYTVSGKITLDTNPLPDVAVTLGTLSTVTATDGTYAFTNVPANTAGMILPVLNGYTFNPINYGVAALAADLPNQNFVATKSVTPPVPPVVNPDLTAIMDELKIIESKNDEVLTRLNDIFK